jgi:uncharacterized protein HemX
MRSSSWKLLVFLLGIGAVWLVRQQVENQDEKMRAETRAEFEKQEAGEEHGLTPGQVVQLRWDQGQEFERHEQPCHARRAYIRAMLPQTDDPDVTALKTKARARFSAVVGECNHGHREIAGVRPRDLSGDSV